MSGSRILARGPALDGSIRASLPSSRGSRSDPCTVATI